MSLQTSMKTVSRGLAEYRRLNGEIPSQEANRVEVTEQYQFRLSKRFSALQRSDDSRGLITIQKLYTHMKISAQESLSR